MTLLVATLGEQFLEGSVSAELDRGWVVCVLLLQDKSNFIRLIPGPAWWKIVGLLVRLVVLAWVSLLSCSDVLLVW
eukprot:scaffold4223_cov189-Amphora_coffeaeformis.AAC.23